MLLIQDLSADFLAETEGCLNFQNEQSTVDVSKHWLETGTEWDFAFL